VVAAIEGACVVKLHELSIPDLYVLESPVWGDERGFFREWFTAHDAEAAGAPFLTKQANLSVSARNVVRGLHYSLAPQGQAKVVTCVFGEIDDVIVDVRVGSPTFGGVEVVHLRAEDGKSVFLPVGVAHGFCVTSDHAALAYLLSSPFNAALELEIHPFDPEVKVPWSVDAEPTLSAKDAAAPSLSERRVANQLPSFRP
jgi:dTDP-4-dehydrorhamnose 3,5-epimerase